MRTAIILSGGKSSRFNFVDKSFLLLEEKPLILHIIDAISGAVDEIVVAISDHDREKIERIGRIFNGNLDRYAEGASGTRHKIAVDPVKGFGPVIGILAGLEQASAEYSIVLGCDTPYVNEGIVEHLFDSAMGYDAAIPRWENGFFEALYAVYRKEPMIEAVKEAIREKERGIRYSISKLGSINYVPAEKIKKMEPRAFVNINTPGDLDMVKINAT
jgi:molybdopterin-guanine dinucleotide biosynthesis protein A